MFKNRAIFLFLGTLFTSTSYATLGPGYIEHLFNDKCEYLQGRIALKQDSRGTLFLAPEKPSRSTPQMSIKFDEPLEVLEEPPLSLPFKNEEAILGAIISGKDGRSRIQDTTEWPYRIYTNLAMYFSSTNKHCGGSGVLVGPHHILTCGHNIYSHDNSGWASTIQAIPALNDGVAPFDIIKAARVYVFKEWVERGDTNFDIALIVLEKSVGFQTGWSGLLYQTDQKLLRKEINITGYPGDKRGSSSNLINPQMWTMSHKIRYISPERFHYLIDTFRGQSGSAIWINKWGQPYTLGIHTHSGDGRNGNSGVRLSNNKLKVIVDLMNKTYVLKEVVPISQPLSILQPKGSLPSTTGTPNIPQPHKQAEAQYNLGVMYANGRGVEKNYVEAKEWFSNAADQGHARAQCCLGVMYANGWGVEKNYVEAKEWFSKAADKELAEAQCCLGVMYESGCGVTKDEATAVNWYQQAADKGHARAQYNLGWMYENGCGIVKDEATAVNWYQQAAEQGHAKAQNKLIRILGHRIAKN